VTEAISSLSSRGGEGWGEEQTVEHKRWCGVRLTAPKALAIVLVLAALVYGSFHLFLATLVRLGMGG